MRRLNRTFVDFRDEEGNVLNVMFSNRGEPYREGVEFYLRESNYRSVAGVFLSTDEVRRMRDTLNIMLGDTK